MDFLKAFADALAKSLIAPFRKLLVRWVWRKGEEQRAKTAGDFARRNTEASKSGDTSEIDKDL